MRYLSQIMKLNLLLGQLSLALSLPLFAQDYDDEYISSDDEYEGSYQIDGSLGSGGMRQDRSNIEVTDLNEINLQEAQKSWENIQSPAGSDVTSSIRIDEIIEPSSEYRYSAFGKQDPFKRPSIPPAAAGRDGPQQSENILGSEIPMVSPLQAYPLDDLTVKGVWGFRTGESRAIIMTPKKEGIVVKVGDPISAGKILRITREKLVVRQYRIREDGVREFEDLELLIGSQRQERQGIIRLSPGQDPEFVTYDEVDNRPGRNDRVGQGEGNVSPDMATPATSGDVYNPIGE